MRGKAAGEEATTDGPRQREAGTGAEGGHVGGRRADGERAPYSPPRLDHHGRLDRLTGAGEGTDLDGAGGFAFSGAEP